LPNKSGLIARVKPAINKIIPDILRNIFIDAKIRRINNRKSFQITVSCIQIGELGLKRRKRDHEQAAVKDINVLWVTTHKQKKAAEAAFFYAVQESPTVLF
jgi:hypothetical protein